MKYSTLLLVIVILFTGCSQKEMKSPPVIDYQGKELSEDEIDDFFEKELAHFESLQEDTSVVIGEIDDVSRFQTPGKKSPLVLQNLDLYNISDKLLAPFKVGRISVADFSQILDTLSDNVKKYIPYHFQTDYYPQLKGNENLLNKIVAIDARLDNGQYGFFIKATQQAPGFAKMIEDSLRSEALYRKKHPHSGFLLSRYAVTGNNKITLELLKIAIDRMEPNRSIDSPLGDNLNVFEYLMLNGDDATKTKTKELLFEYLGKARMGAIDNAEVLLSTEVSPELRKLVEDKFKSLDTISDSQLRKEAEENFQGTYLKHYARNLGMSSLKYIQSLLILSPQQISYGEDDPTHFKISDSKADYTTEYALSALEQMVKYNELSDSEKKTVLAVLTMANLQNSKSYKWRQYISILKAMYPERPYEDFASLFSNIASGYRYQEPGEYWNRKLYSADNLGTYLNYMAQLGFDTTRVTKNSRFLFLKEYKGYDNEVIFWGLFEMLGNSVHYDCETGVWPNPYDELMAQYLNVAPELSDYAVHFSYKKLDEDYNTEYTVAIFNDKNGFITHRNDDSDWYHPNTVEKLLNTALKEKGVSKRFIQIATGDQTVLSVYCNPGQLKLFADKFGVPLMHEQNYDDY